MGYRSEIQCLIYGEEEKLSTFLTMQALVIASPVFEHFKEDLKRYTLEYEEKTIHILNLYGSSWKWHGGYEDVQAWHTLMGHAEEFGLNYEFIRIGEGDGLHTDIEQMSTSDNFEFLSFNRPTISLYVELEDEIPIFKRN